MDGWMYTYGNVKAQSPYLVSDGRGSNAPHTSTDSFTITGYEPAIKSITDYYPFGMQMPDRCYSDGTTHTTNISAVTTVPVHRMSTNIWPDGGAVGLGGASISSGLSPLLLGANAGDSLKYELPRNISGILHTAIIYTTGFVPFGFNAVIIQDSTVLSSSPIVTGSPTILNYTPLSGSTFAPYLYIYNTSSIRGVIAIDSVQTDTVTYEPYHVLSSISSSDGYAYGFNGQMKVNEWAGSGNHTTALFWEYDVRTGRRGNLDPINHAGISPYSTYLNNPIRYIDPLGLDTTKGFAPKQLFELPVVDFVDKRNEAKHTKPNNTYSWFGGSGDYNIVQARNLDIGINQQGRQKVGALNSGFKIWLGMGAAPFAGIAAIETSPMWAPAVIDVLAFKSEFNLISGASDFAAQIYVNDGNFKEWNIMSTVSATCFSNPLSASLPGGFFNISFNSISGHQKIYQPVTDLQTWTSIGLNTIGNVIGDQTESLYLSNLRIRGIGNIGTTFFTRFLGQQTGDVSSGFIDKATKKQDK